MALDWQVLKRLRSVFLNGNGGPTDYWQEDSDLDHYDATFAQRIGWKWDSVLAWLAERGWRPPSESVLLDWGCGSGIAARAFLDFCGPAAVRRVHFWDRSLRAVRFAVAKAVRKYPQIEVMDGLPAAPDVVLISHVLTELTTEQVEALTTWLAEARSVLWVEPGSFEASHRLIEVRERLRHRFHVIAPCTHAGACGLLAPGNERHWCHHFASSPPAVFSDPFWGRFAQVLGIELRSLPVSFVALDKRLPSPLPEGTVRVIGRPRVYKGRALVQACEAEGVAEWALRRRAVPEMFRRLEKGRQGTLQVWTRAEGGVVAATELDSRIRT